MGFHRKNKQIASRQLGFVLAFMMIVGLTVQASITQAQPSTFAPLVKRLRDKVVHIGVRDGMDETEDEELRPFLQPHPQEGMGSGFVVDSEGLILTNYHVISGGERIEVVLQDGRNFTGSVVGVDDHTDLALVKIPATGLSVVAFGDSSKVEVGDWVVAIGNPLGLDYSVTAGIISAKGRNIFEAENLAYGEFLQTDAAINPGNSGGPLFDLKGRVIGVNTAISSRGFGIGFAVPSNLVVEVVRQLRTTGHVVRGWMGIAIRQLKPQLARDQGLPEKTKGILVDEVVAGGPAAKAGVRPGDVLTHYRGKPLRKVAQLQKLVAFSPLGGKAQLKALRQGKAKHLWNPISMFVQIEKAPGDVAASGQIPELVRLGLGVVELDEAERKKLQLPKGHRLVVEKVEPETPSEKAGVQRGDVILEVNRKAVRSMEALGRLLRSSNQNQVSLLVQRKGKVLFLSLARK